MDNNTTPPDNDFADGIALSEIPATGAVFGRVGETAVFLSRAVGEIRAFTASCTHYGGPLGEGLVEDGHVRCPWHHACFSLATGEALAAPAFDPLERWNVEVDGDRAFVREKLEAQSAQPPRPRMQPKRVVIVGGGAAGFAAAEMLRRRGFDGQLTMLSSDSALPCDRPNLSKDYLAGHAPEEWLFLKDEAFFKDRAIDIRLQTAVAAIDPNARVVRTESDESYSFDALLLATGSEPIRPNVPGAMRDNVFTLRTIGDAQSIIEESKQAKKVAIAGASFIGLEVAASLRERGLEVHVIAPEQIPMERILGREIGELIHATHRDKGVIFHLGRTVESFDGQRVRLSDQSEIAVDLLVLGIGVRPRVNLAKDAGLTIDNGVVVNANLETSIPGIFAAGDIARYPGPISGQSVRVEHWVVAERQGQVAAENILGAAKPYRFVPFFWSNHYDLHIRYVGNAMKWDKVTIDGSVKDRDCTARYMLGYRLLAAASIGRDKESLELELALERAGAAGQN